MCNSIRGVMIAERNIIIWFSPLWPINLARLSPWRPVFSNQNVFGQESRYDGLAENILYFSFTLNGKLWVSSLQPPPPSLIWPMYISMKCHVQLNVEISTLSETNARFSKCKYLRKTYTRRIKLDDLDRKKGGITFLSMDSIISNCV